MGDDFTEKLCRLPDNESVSYTHLMPKSLVWDLGCFIFGTKIAYI